MFTIRDIGARLCAVLFISFFCSTTFAGSAKVDVCHIPPSDPESFHTIRVNEKALAAHLAHGDLAGACEAGCAVLCDDGDACTIDDTGDCYQNGCPTDRIPVDCSDGFYCTIDSCDSNDGCAYEGLECTSSDLCLVSICNEHDKGCSNTPVVCGDGFACDPGTGDCVEDEEPYCECFDSTDLQALGDIDSCGNEPDRASIIYIYGGIACSGANCSSPDYSTCGYFNGQTFLDSPVTDEEDADCRALIVSYCEDSSAAGEEVFATSPAQQYSNPLISN